MQLRIKLWYFKRLSQTTGYYLPDCVSGTGTRLQLQIISLRITESTYSQATTCNVGGETAWHSRPLEYGIYLVTTAWLIYRFTEKLAITHKKHIRNWDTRK